MQSQGCTMAANTSLENQALNQPNYMAPGNVTNQQQVSNFLSALKQGGAGSNNSFMSSGPQAAPQQQSLVGNSNIYNTPSQMPYGIYNNQLNNSNFANWFGNQGGINPAAPTLQNNQIPVQQAAPQMGPINQGDPYGQQQMFNPQQSYNNFAGQQSQRAYNPYAQSAAGYNPNAQQSMAGAAPITQSAPQQTQRAPMQSAMPSQALNMQSPLMQQNLMTSDANAKTNIQPAKIQNFMDNLHAWEYEYKDKADGEGKFIGPMAQELQKTGAKDAVIKGSDGKLKVDTANPRLKMFELAALAHINQQFKNMQKQFYQLKKKVK